MYLNTRVINHLPSIIQTVTSPQLREIRFILSDPLHDKDKNHIDEWELVDNEVCALVDRIRPTCGNWRLSLRFVITSAFDTGAVGKLVALLFPASSRHQYINVSTDCAGLP